MTYPSHFGWLLPKFYGILIVVVHMYAHLECALVRIVLIAVTQVHTFMEVTP